MEKKVKKKRIPGTSVSKEGKDTSRKNVPLTQVQKPTEHRVLNLPLNPDTARQAVILSEIIGKPVSKRGRR